VLYCRFHGTPGSYLYFDVDRSVYGNLVYADSVGSYHHQNVVDEYPFAHIVGDNE